MSKIYSTPIPVDNLAEVQSSILRYIPKTMWNRSLLFPIDQKELVQRTLVGEILKKYNWVDSIEGISVVVVPGRKELQIHHDWGTLTHSFNIPILNCANTWTVWYDTDQEPRVITQENYTYCDYDASKCTEVERLELVTPHLLDVRKPHGVLNPTVGTRLVLAFRLTPDFQRP